MNLSKCNGCEAEFVSSVDKEWLLQVRNESYLCSDGTFGKYEAVSLFDQTKLITRAFSAYIL